jgi:hypothetical protein
MGVLAVNISLKKAKVSGFHLALYALLGMNELKYFLLIAYTIVCFVHES